MSDLWSGIRDAITKQLFDDWFSHVDGAAKLMFTKEDKDMLFEAFKGGMAYHSRLLREMEEKKRG